MRHENGDDKDTVIFWYEISSRFKFCVDMNLCGVVALLKLFKKLFLYT